MTIYSPDTVEEMLVAIQEERAKSDILHEERSKAYREMREAVAHHEFMVHACREVDRDCSVGLTRLENLIRRDARAAVAAGVQAKEQT